MANYRIEIESKENLGTLLAMIAAHTHSSVKKVEETKKHLPTGSRDDWWETLYIEEIE